jgi:hypothetical protein
MAQAQTYMGTPAQLAKQISKLPASGKYMVTVTLQEAEVDVTRPKMITFGMFPQLKALTEEDFKSAEWHGDSVQS